MTRSKTNEVCYLLTARHDEISTAIDLAPLPLYQGMAYYGTYIGNYLEAGGPGGGGWRRREGSSSFREEGPGPVSSQFSFLFLQAMFVFEKDSPWIKITAKRAI